MTRPASCIYMALSVTSQKSWVHNYFFSIVMKEEETERDIGKSKGI